MPGPYFENQQAAACGHYYPDVIRLHDEKREKEYIRILDCTICGRVEIPITEEMFSQGRDIKPEDLPDLRQSELERIAKMSEE